MLTPPEVPIGARKEHSPAPRTDLVFVTSCPCRLRGVQMPACSLSNTKAARDLPVINTSVSTAMDALRPCPRLSIEFGLDLRFVLAPQSPVRPSRPGLAHPWVFGGQT